MAIQILWIIQKSNIFATRKNGLVAEWLGRGLQNLVQRFESARDLQMKRLSKKAVSFFMLQNLLWLYFAWQLKRGYDFG